MLSRLILALVHAVFTEWTAASPSYCSNPPNLQKCRAAIPAWYFNNETQSCEEFVYGGCPQGEEENRFTTKYACIRKCGQAATCSLPPEVGTCRAAFPRWYYNFEHRKCEKFTYGGCEGNSNNFFTQGECERACAGSFLLCELGRKFDEIGVQAVHDEYRQKEWFTHSCVSRCEAVCLEDKEWGYCLAFSVRTRWYGCNCYLFDRYLSKLAFDPDTKGHTRNRQCAEDTEPTVG